MPFTRVHTLPLPTREVVLSAVPALLRATGELTRTPRTCAADAPRFVAPLLSPAWSNIDFEPDLPTMEAADRRYVERQIQRSHFLEQWHFEQGADDNEASRWSLSETPDAPLGAPSMVATSPFFVMLFLEVPVFSVDRTFGILRGQRQEPAYAEDFAYQLQRKDSQWHVLP